METRKYIKNKKQLGKNLKRARIYSGISQNDVSKLARINRSSLSYYENGQNIPTIFTIIKLMGIYKITIDDIIFIREDY